MKVLVLTQNNNAVCSVPAELSVHTFVPFTSDTNSSSDTSVLREAAKFAENEDCEMLLALPGKLTLDDAVPLFNALPDADLPTALAVAENAEESETAKDTKTAVLMLQLLTGERICGFRSIMRIYPVKLLLYLPESFFDEPMFCVKVLIRAAEAGYKLAPAPVERDLPEYPSCAVPKLRFFMPELLKKLFPFPHRRLCPRNFQKEKMMEFLAHPMVFLKYLLKENATPGGLALAAATGMFIGTLPLFGIHTASIIYVSIKLRLNKMLSVNISHLCMPPFVPFACIELGHYMLHGEWLAAATMQTVVKELHLRLLEWLLGSLILAPANAVFFALLTYIIAKSLGAGQQSKAGKA